MALSYYAYMDESVTTILCLKNMLPFDIINIIVDIYLTLNKFNRDSISCGDNLLVYNNVGITDKYVTYDILLLKGIKFIGQHSEFRIAVTDNGLYGVGNNFSSRIGTNIASSLIPHPIFLKENVVDISFGVYHTIFLTDKCEIYGCGDNKRNQLGLTNSIYPTPEKIDINNVIAVSCGAFHTLILTKNGVYYCGNNKSLIKLDIDDVINVYAYQDYSIFLKKDGTCHCDHIDSSLYPKNVVELFCYKYHILCYTKQKQLYFHGKNIGFPKQILKPYNKSFTTILINNILYVTGHNNYTIIFTKDKNYVFGTNNYVKNYDNLINNIKID